MIRAQVPGRASRVRSDEEATAVDIVATTILSSLLLAVSVLASSIVFATFAGLRIDWLGWAGAALVVILGVGAPLVRYKRFNQALERFVWGLVATVATATALVAVAWVAGRIATQTGTQTTPTPVPTVVPTPAPAATPVVQLDPRVDITSISLKKDVLEVSYGVFQVDQGIPTASADPTKYIAIANVPNSSIWIPSYSAPMPIEGGRVYRQVILIPRGTAMPSRGEVTVGLAAVKDGESVWSQYREQAAAGKTNWFAAWPIGTLLVAKQTYFVSDDR
jgi:hypothetical protein